MCSLNENSITIAMSSKVLDNDTFMGPHLSRRSQSAEFRLLTTRESIQEHLGYSIGSSTVFARTLTGTTLTLKLWEGMFIKELKWLISTFWDAGAAEDLRLIHAGRVLEQQFGRRLTSEFVREATRHAVPFHVVARGGDAPTFERTFGPEYYN